MLFIANIFLVISALVGAFLIAKKNRMGFLIYFVTELCYSYIGWKTGQYGFVAVAGMYLSMNMYSWVSWGKDNDRY